MQAQSQTARSKKLHVLIFIMFCNGDQALPNLPRHSVMHTQCETNPSKGRKKLGVLIFVNVLQMFHNVSTLQNPTYQRVQEAACSDVLILVHVFQPPNPRPFCNASALLNKAGQLCARSFVFLCASKPQNLIMLL